MAPAKQRSESLRHSVLVRAIFKDSQEEKAWPGNTASSGSISTGDFNCNGSVRSRSRTCDVCHALHSALLASDLGSEGPSHRWGAARQPQEEPDRTAALFKSESAGIQESLADFSRTLDSLGEHGQGFYTVWTMLSNEGPWR